MKTKRSRSLRRFISSQSLPSVGLKLRFQPREAHHMIHVCRLKTGDSCEIVDGFGSVGTALIDEIFPDGSVMLKMQSLQVSKTPRAAAFDLMIYVAIPQRGKLDLMIQKAQELGVSAVYPLETSRTIVKMDLPARRKALERWRRIAEEAAKQSQSDQILSIHEPVSVTHVVREPLAAGSVCAVFHPGSDALPFAEWMEGLKSGFKAGPRGQAACRVFIGPEGGFTEEEVSLMIQSLNAAKVSLGSNLLKVDTAFYAVAASLRLLFP